MAFYFSEIEGEPLNVKINLREIAAVAKQWDHPAKGLFKYAEAMSKHGGDILQISKKDRERYCVSLVALALSYDSHIDWWTHMLEKDPPDGMVMTFKEVGPGLYRGNMREIEVVEHRDNPSLLFETIKKKMTKYSYKPNTTLVCLILAPSLYDLKKLATQIAEVDSVLKHIFVIFAGTLLSEGIPNIQELRTTFTMVQLLPTFESSRFDYRPYLDDFKERYEKGQESRVIGDNQVFNSTSNPKYQK